MGERIFTFNQSIERGARRLWNVKKDNRLVRSGGSVILIE